MTFWPTKWWRAIGPLTWAVVAGGLLLAIAAVTDPLGWHRSKLEQAQRAAATGSLEARYRLKEKTAQQWVSRKQGDLQERQIAVSEMTDNAVTMAREQTDAETLLGDDRLRRLREHDRGLCEFSAIGDGCVATTRSATRD